MEKLCTYSVDCTPQTLTRIHSQRAAATTQPSIHILLIHFPIFHCSDCVCSVLHTVNASQLLLHRAMTPFAQKRRIANFFKTISNGKNNIVEARKILCKKNQMCPFGKKCFLLALRGRKHFLSEDGWKVG